MENKNIKVTCVVCQRVRPISEMRNVDTVNGADSDWIYACNDVNPHGLGGTCYGKYDRKRHFYHPSDCGCDECVNAKRGRYD